MGTTIVMQSRCKTCDGKGEIDTKIDISLVLAIVTKNGLGYKIKSIKEVRDTFNISLRDSSKLVNAVVTMMLTLNKNLQLIPWDKLSQQTLPEDIVHKTDEYREI